MKDSTDKISSNSITNNGRTTMEVREMVARCAPWEPNDEDYAEQREYLISMLSSDDNAEADQLFETIDQFFEDPDASRRLVGLWRESLAAADDAGAALTVAAAFSLGQGIEAMAPTTPNDEEEMAATETKSRSPKRERRQKKKKRGAKSIRDRRRGQAVSPAPADDSEENINAKEVGVGDLHGKLTKIQNATDKDLDELDDFSSAWDDARRSGRVWGGRGFGGRGVNRGLAAYRGRDAVVNGLTLAFSGKELLRETHLAINHGHRYGLWGRNGVGKSTLLRRIAGGRIPGWPLHLRVGMVEQEVLGSKRTVRECIRDVETAKNGNVEGKREALGEGLAALETELAELVVKNDTEALEMVSERLAELHEHLEEVERKIASSEGEYAGDHLAKDAFAGLEESAIAILRGLQFKESMLDVSVNELSGGWRMRVALAEALYSRPDVLLLDEPTNHLDASAQIFLEDYILENELTLVIVSHDAHFLDAVCTDMIKFENQKLEYHAGNYSAFKQREAELWSKNSRIADATIKKEKKAAEFISKQRSMANSNRRDDNKQRQAKERQKKLGRIGLYNADGKKFRLLTERRGTNMASHINGSYTNAAGFQSGHVDNTEKEFGERKQFLNFRFPAAVPLKGATGEYAPLITMDECRFRYNSNDWLLQDMTLSVSVGSRIALLGKNGSGKTTLVKLLCGELLPDSKVGAFHRHANLKIAHISQHHVEHLGSHLENSAVEYFLMQHNAKNEYEARQFLGGFGLAGPLALQPIGTLSGGQKARLAFATVMYDAPHILVLDEPTNHLDGDSLASLERAIAKFEGAVVAVSHNQDFLSRISKEVWTVSRGRVGIEAVAGPGEAKAGASATSFDDVYARYKENLRREAQQRQTRRAWQQQRKKERNATRQKVGRR